MSIITPTASPRILIRATQTAHGPNLELRRAGETFIVARVMAFRHGLSGWVVIDGVPSTVAGGKKYSFTTLSLDAARCHQLIADCLGPLDFSRRAPALERAA